VAVVSVRALHRVVLSVLATAVMGVGAGTAVVALPTAAYADSTYSMESQFIAKINSAREANGLSPYSVAGDLTSIARQHSDEMASKQELYHNPNLTTQVQNWQAVGENVGEGPTVDDIHTAFMNSPEHRANILDHDFTQVGVGVAVDKNGVIWVTEDFREPMGSTGSSSSGTHHSSSGSTSGSTQHSSTTGNTATTGYQGASRTSPVSRFSPNATPSPRSVLMHRLHALRHRHVARRPIDPVAQAYDYVATLSNLTG
jgi:hypothetical protein